ncbi:sigma-54 interaction domain-containing protein [Desulfosporosinus nitroreducens]|uniref:sigma-54 interaction domain-containing protein n=1 Tax=Desulfosporosinus nitroreducens TaxID=2018668 RepID=UPI00207C8383|nr:sigma 54-interacting transcriptional regulator [Desulfosporosinus nitroreducens]MCO1602609.1 sigma 54-interacting transcriptional regulator [Desulfosporosinus nitroreducens]
MSHVEETISQELLEHLRKRNDELEHQNRDLLGMLENSYDGLLIADNESRILYINPSIERIMGLKYPDSIGQTTREQIEKGITDVSATLKVIESGQKETVVINTINGKIALSTGVPSYDSNGKIHRVYCNVRDITDLNQLKQKHQQTQVLALKYLAELNQLKKSNNSEIIAHSKEMRKVIDLAYRVANVDSSVLLLGESGVGKDLIAKVIHKASPRNEAGLFLKINCGAIPENLLESELFGYETGAFTGASKEGKAGYFEFVNKGTLFLDEIGDLPKNMQVKLLNVIQDQKVTRVGGVKPREIDVRILAATNKNLEEMVMHRLFREDLYYRLNVLPITIPPLRERREDILLIAQHYADHFNKKYNLNVKFSKEAIEILSKYDWPGNVRELTNLVERLIIIAQETVITPEHIPSKYHSAYEPLTLEYNYQAKTLNNAMEEFENKYIAQMITHCGSREEAAVQLDISLSSLTRRIRRLRRSKLTFIND